VIPTDNDIELFDFEINPQPSKTYKLNEDSINGICDNLDAIKQAIYLILSIERYKYPIYSWDFGIELMDLYGQPMPFVVPELERRIKEALIQDDRITNVDNFNFEVNKNKVYTTFLVHTIYGNLESEKEVEI
jgi:hypothetical protein